MKVSRAFENFTGGSRATKPRRALHGIAALSLSGTMIVSALLVGHGPASAQAASVGTSEASVAPANSIFYFGLSLDESTPQWQIADQLLAKLGETGGAAGILDSAASDTAMSGSGGAIDTSALLGGEAALIVTNLDAASSGASGLTNVVGGLDFGIGTPTTDVGATAGAPAASGMVLVIDPPDLAAATKAIDDALVAGAQSADLPVTETPYGGVTVKSFPGNADTGETGQAYAVVGDVIAVANTAADLEPVIDTASGKTDALSSVEAFTKADQALKGDRLGFGFMNGSAISAGLTALDATTTDLVTAFGDLFGLNRATGIAVVADPAGFRFNTVELPYDGASAEPGGAAVDLGSAQNVPANTLLYANGFNVGQGSVLQGLALYLVTSLNSALNPALGGTPVPMPNVDELYGGAAQLLGFNLRLDLIDQLVGEYVFAVWNLDGSNPTTINLILTSKTGNAGIVADALSKLSLVVQAASSGMANVTTQTIGNSAVSVVTIGDGTTAPAVTIDYGVVDGTFMLGTNDSIEQYRAGFDDSLADAPGFKAGLAALPTEYDGVFYVNLQEAIAAGAALSSGLGTTGGDLDNSASCGRYTSQEAAQAAYDADSVTNYDLDLNFNGIACEDYFAPATPEASPVAGADYPGLSSFTTVSYKKDGLAYTSSILLVGDN